MGLGCLPEKAGGGGERRLLSLLCCSIITWHLEVMGNDVAHNSWKLLTSRFQACDAENGGQRPFFVQVSHEAPWTRVFWWGASVRGMSRTQGGALWIPRGMGFGRRGH